jgi:hypothetical protein
MGEVAAGGAMSNDGKKLETLVAFVEETLLPQGFDVKVNQKLFMIDGVQLAEFDVEVRGKLGTTEIAWLIECRDRPSDGPAPAAWIEQLGGRRLAHGFNKITAVSTTGFGPPAREVARRLEVELREVKALDPESFSDWLRMTAVQHWLRKCKLEGAEFQIPEGPKAELRLAALHTAVSSQDLALRSTKSGGTYRIETLFAEIAGANAELWEGIVPNEGDKPVKMQVRFPPEDRFAVDTPAGPIEIHGIAFSGTLSIRASVSALIETAEYRDTETGIRHSGVVRFDPQPVHDFKLGVELHRIEKTGVTHVLVRKFKS